MNQDPCKQVVSGGGDCVMNICNAICPIVTNRSKTCKGITSNVLAEPDFAHNLAWKKVAKMSTQDKSTFDTIKTIDLFMSKERPPETKPVVWHDDRHTPFISRNKKPGNELVTFDNRNKQAVVLN